MNILSSTGKVHDARFLRMSDVYFLGKAGTLFPPNDFVNSMSEPTRAVSRLARERGYGTPCLTTSFGTQSDENGM